MNIFDRPAASAFRPALLLLSNFAAGGDASAEGVIRIATVMEMLHTATLVHDDIIDNADTGGMSRLSTGGSAIISPC